MPSSSEYTINVAGCDDEIEPNDMHCPHIGTSGLNFVRSRCEARKINPLHRKTCYPVCFADRPKKPKIHAKTGTTKAYRPKTVRKGTVRQQMVDLLKKDPNLSNAELATKLGTTVNKISDHRNKARRFGEL